MVWQRDLANALPMLLQNATRLTQVALKEHVAASDTEKASGADVASKTQVTLWRKLFGWRRQAATLETSALDQTQTVLFLDLMTRYLARAYEDMRKEKYSAAHVMGEILEEAKNYQGSEVVLALFGWFLLVSIYTFLFASVEISTQAPTKFDEDCMGFFGIVSVMALIRDEELLRQLSRYLREEGLVNARFDLRPMTHITQQYVKEVREAQAVILKKLLTQASS